MAVDLAVRCGELGALLKPVDALAPALGAIDHFVALRSQADMIMAQRLKAPLPSNISTLRREALARAGRQAVEQFCWQAAIEIWSRYVGLYPDNPDGFRRLAASYSALGEHDLAVEHYSKSLAFRYDGKVASALDRERNFAMRMGEALPQQHARFLRHPLMQELLAATRKEAARVDALLPGLAADLAQLVALGQAPAGDAPGAGPATQDASARAAPHGTPNLVAGAAPATALPPVETQAPPAPPPALPLPPESVQEAALPKAQAVVAAPVAAPAPRATPEALASTPGKDGDGPLRFAFADAKLRLNQDCVRQDGRLVSRQDRSTPGFRINLDAPLEYLAKVEIHDLASTTNLVLALSEDGKRNVEQIVIEADPVPRTVTLAITTSRPINIVYLLFRNVKTGDEMRFGEVVLRTAPPRPRNAMLLAEASRNLGAPALAAGARKAAGVASIPGREDGLRAVVNSLLPQVNELHVYLNGYPEVPAFLRALPEIKVYSSQEFDDVGDAGKFFGFPRSRCDFYLTVDDDIAYPADYVARMTATAARFRAPVGVHGSLLKWPNAKYYDSSRYVLHFRDQNPAPQRVHVLGTGTLCFAVADVPQLPAFPYRNMADIWFARHCAESGMPMFCIDRPFGWLQQIGSDEDSIFRANSATAAIQPAIVEQQIRQFASRMFTTAKRLPRIVIGIKTFNRRDYLKQCVDSIMRTLSPQFDVVLVIADDGSTDTTPAYLRELRLPIETHVIYNFRRYAVGQMNSIIDRALEVQADFIFMLDDDVIFRRAGWMERYYDNAMISGYHHLCFLDLEHWQELRERRKETSEVVVKAHGGGELVARVPVEGAMGALFTLTPELIRKVGYGDEVNFPIRGLWHLDYSARCCRAGGNEAERFFDVADSADYLTLQNNVTKDYQSAINWDSPEFKVATSPAERARRWSLVRDAERLQVTREQSRDPSRWVERVRPRSLISVNAVFDQVYVLNLDRRPDRMATLDLRLRRAGVAYQRFAATDGATDPEVVSDYAAYVERRRAAAAAGLKTRLNSSRGFLFDYISDLDRVAFLEGNIGGPAIRSRGAWAYSRTYQRILMDALEKGYDRILVLDDDGLFHQDFARLFDQAVRQLPVDWKVLQLGTMQYDWNLTRPYSANLYLPDGTSVASHAVGLHNSCFALLLDYIGRWTMPFDIGPLHYLCRTQREKSFVISPNLIIQDQSESDIQSSDVAESEGLKPGNIYRWELGDYA